MEWWDYLIIGVVVAVVLAICLTFAIVYDRKDRAYRRKIDFSRIGTLVTKRNNFLTEKEYDFFKVLTKVSASMGYVAFPKVCVGNLVNFRAEDKKHGHDTLHSIVDFCLFSSHDFSPVVVIDLYDNTIADQSLLGEMDTFIVRSLRYSGIPIFKISLNDAMDEEKLKKAILNEISAFEKNILLKEKKEDEKKRKANKK